jgi:hypothetical protein
VATLAGDLALLVFVHRGEASPIIGHDDLLFRVVFCDLRPVAALEKRHRSTRVPQSIVTSSWLGLRHAPAAAARQGNRAHAAQLIQKPQGELRA